MMSSLQIQDLSLLQKLGLRHKRQLYLVGGFLRDAHLGRVSHDMDFAVSSGAVVFARIFARQIKGAFVLLDKETGCARVVKKRESSICVYDFADFRGKDIVGDIKGRDFTINTFALDIQDWFPDAVLKDICCRNPRALADIKNKEIRAVSVKAFDEDPLRLLRAYSLMAQTGFKIDAKTTQWIRAKVRQIQNVSPERVREEFFKILASQRAARVLRAMERSGLLFAAIPQLKIMETVPQGGYHHLNVWKHSLLVLENFERLMKEFAADADINAYCQEPFSGGHSRASLIKFACLLHDIGKPETRKKEPQGRISFHGHEHAGCRIARVIAQDLFLSVKERHFIEDMVTLHLRPGYLSNFKRPSAKSVYRFLRDARGEAAAVVLLSLADQRSTLGPLTTDYDREHHDAVCRGLLQDIFIKKADPLKPWLNGDDLIQELRLTPGPLFKKILTKVEEAQFLGEVKNRQEALALAAALAAGVGEH